MRIVSVIVSFAAALGAGFFVSEQVFGFTGATPTCPLAFVFLVALGVDYNIFLMARVREETQRREPREGVLRGLAVTGGITSAGIVLAGTSRPWRCCRSSCYRARVRRRLRRPPRHVPGPLHPGARFGPGPRPQDLVAVRAREADRRRSHPAPTPPRPPPHMTEVPAGGDANRPSPAAARSRSAWPRPLRCWGASPSWRAATPPPGEPRRRSRSSARRSRRRRVAGPGHDQPGRRRGGRPDRRSDRRGGRHEGGDARLAR